MSVATNKILMGSGATEPTDDDFNLVTGLFHLNGSNAGTNATFLDSSSNAGTVSTSAAPAQGTFSPFSADEGKWSVYFDGGDYLQFGTSSDFIFNADFTIEMWVFRTASTTNGEQIYEGRQGGDTNRLLFWINPSNQVSIFYNGSTIGTSSATVPLNQWSHIALTRDGTSMQAYIDGTRVISITESGYIDRPNATLYIGKNNASSDYDYKGYISNLRVNRGTAHYTGASATVPTSPLTGITGSQGMLLCGSNILQDKLVYSNAPRHAITVGGSPKVYPFSPFAPSDSYSAAVNGGSAYFNGTGYTSIAANTDFNILGDGTFTVEYWLYAEEWNGSYADHAGVFNGVSAGWLIYQLGTDIEVYMNGVDMISVARPSLHSWHHIALTRSSGTLRLFIDGVQAGFSNATTGSDQSQPLRVGGDSGGGRNGLKGYISNFRLVKGTAVYTSAFTPPTAPVTAITNTEALLNFTNAQIIDSSGKYNIGPEDHAQLSTSVKKLGTASYKGDGTGDRLTLFPKELAPIGTRPWTVEGFVYINAHKNYNGIYSAGYGIQFYVNANGKFQAWVGGANGWLANGLESTATVSTTTWTHFALVRDASADTITWYVNGTAGGQATSTTADVAPVDGGYSHRIGSYESGTYSLNGYIDELRITHKARYTSNFTAPTKEYLDK